MKNQVIKCLTPEHGKKILDYWKSKGVDTSDKNGTFCESDNHPWIYYGVISGRFENYSYNDVQMANAEIIELPEDEFDMTTNEGRLAYAKKHYPVGTKYKSLYSGQELIVGSYDGHLCLQPEGIWGVYDFLTNKWAEIVEEKQEEIVMETQRLSRQGLKEIHSIACSAWKRTLEEWGNTNPLEDYVELTQEQVDNIFKACTKEQLPIVSKHLKQDDGSVDVSNVTYNENGALLGYKYIIRHNAITSITNGFWLNPDFNWEVKMISDTLFLVPTKKK
jgi:hypothetical protein